MAQDGHNGLLGKNESFYVNFVSFVFRGDRATAYISKLHTHYACILESWQCPCAVDGGGFQVLPCVWGKSLILLSIST